MTDRIPLALLPGLLTDAAHWAHQIEALAVRAMTERIGRDAFLRQQAAIMGRPDSLPGLPGIACPTLVLCGRQVDRDRGQRSPDADGAGRGGRYRTA